ncbi:MAG: protein kinase [Sandaracinaceae bacterium]
MSGDSSISSSDPGEHDDEVYDLVSESNELEPHRADGRVGRYRLCYELGSGGMATVYLARTEGPGGFEKLVALKCMLPHLAKKPGFVDMFFDEARIAARIDHPNVCTVFDFGDADGRHFIAMEYVVGETVAALIRRSVKLGRWLDPIAAAQIVADACEGLHAAHELVGRDGRPMNVVHRDVTPHNLTVGYDGTVRVMDFGIARSSDRLHQTKTGVLKGKIAYMAPEQFRGRPVDRRADVWALGVVLYEMLTGKRLFRRGSEIETITAVDSAPIAPPHTIVEGIPQPLSDVVMRALSRDVEGRFSTARAMGTALREHIAKTGRLIGPPEVSGLMEELFPEEHGGRLRLIDDARTVHEGPPAPDAAIGEKEPPTESRVIERATGPSPLRTAVGVAVLTAATTLGFGGFLLLDRGEEPVLVASKTRSAAAPIVDDVETGVPIGVTAERPESSPDPRPPEAVPPDAVSPDAVPPDAVPPDAVPPDAVPPDAVPDVAPEPPPPSTPPSAEGAPASAPDPEATRRGNPDPGATNSRRRTSVAPTRPRPPPAPGTGALVVVTSGGWADIYVDGVARGRTPSRLVLRAGPHTIVLRPSGGATRITRQVDVDTDGVTRLAVPL